MKITTLRQRSVLNHSVSCTIHVKLHNRLTKVHTAGQYHSARIQILQAGTLTDLTRIHVKNKTLGLYTELFESLRSNFALFILFKNWPP